MYREVQVRVLPRVAGNERELHKVAAVALKIELCRVCRVDVVRRSIDARRREVVFNLTLGVHVDRVEQQDLCFKPAYRDVSSAERKS